MSTRTLLAIASLTTLAGAAIAQPKLVVTATTDDLAANGNTATGWIYDGAIGNYAPYKYTRGIGFQRVPGTAPGSGGPISISADGSVLAAPMNNSSNWQGLNCFPGYDAAGNLRTLQNPCSMRVIAHRFTASTGWVNAGSLARTVDPVTGRMIGGTTCDATINTPYNISGNGRYIVGGAYSAVAINSAGNPSTGLCGDFFAFRYDSQTGAFEKLPTSSRTTLANYVSGDGSVVTGYDLNGVTRRLVVWADGVETILDPAVFKGGPVNGPGTAIVAGVSPTFSLAQFGTYAAPLVKWTRSGTSWIPQNLGTPADHVEDDDSLTPCNALIARGISDDGNTVVGDAYYGGEIGEFVGNKRLFIWKAGLNGGVPMDLSDYLATLDPSGAKLEGTAISTVYGLSADGNTLLVSGSDTRTTCTAPNQTLPGFFSGLLSLDGSVHANEPATIAVQPVDASTRCEWPGWGEVINVIAGGSWPLNYQWQREDPNAPNTWVNLTNACSGLPFETFPRDASWEFEGVNGPQLRVNVVGQGGGHEGRYRCIVSNAYGSQTSDPATLDFAGPMNPQTPQPATACPGSPATFTVGTVDGRPEYRWEICTSAENDTWAILSNGTNNFSFGSLTVSNTLTPTVTVTPVTLSPGQTYQFRCHLADSCGTLQSNPGTLTVGSPCGLADLGAQGGIQQVCGDGLLDNNDFIAFIDYFFSADSHADQGVQGGEAGSDGLYDNNDFIVFINNFFDGCNS